MQDWKKDSVMLTLENFRNFNGFRKFYFKRGLNIIQAPNATGKTSIIEALQLFVTDDLLNENVINKKSNNSTIELDMDKKYRIRLFIDNTTGEIKKEQNLSFPFNHKINDICFISENHHIMQAAINKDFNIIIQWLDSLTDYPYYQKIYELAIKRIDHLEIEKNKWQSDLFAKKKQLLVLKENLLSRKALNETIYEEMIKQDSKYERYKEIFAKENELKKHVEQLKQDKIKIETQIKMINETIIKAKEQIEILQKQLITLEKSEFKAEEKLEENEKRIKKLEDIIKERHNLIKPGGNFSNSLNILEENIRTIRNLIESNQHTCPTCFSTITREHLEEVLLIKEKARTKLLTQIQEIRKEIEKYKQEKEKIEKENRELKIKLPAEKTKIERLISQNEVKLRQAEYKKPKLTESLAKCEKELEEKSKQYKSLFQLTENYRKEIEENNEKINETKNRLAEIKHQLNEISKEIMKIDYQTKELNKYDIFKKRLNVLLDRVSQKIDFIQTSIIDNINKDIKKITESFDFNGIKEIFIDDDLQINIIKSGNKSIEFSDLSMFERKTIGVVIAYVLKRQLAKEFPFFVIDEYLNSLDEERDIAALDYLKTSEDIVILTKSTTEDRNYHEITQDNILFLR